MTLKKIIIPFLLSLFLINSVKATTWQTVASGSWSSNTVWQGGVAPPYTSADTFLIKTPIIINSTLTLNSGAYFKIDSTGGICGHEKLTVNTGALVIKYGTLDLDTLYISGGVVYCYPPEEVILTYYGILIGAGSNLYITGGLEVGPWFECRTPEYTYIGLDDISQPEEFSIYPNPFSSSVTISSNSILKNTTLSVYNSSGKIVKEIQNISGETITFSREGLPIGLYYFQLTEDNKTIFSDKLIIVDD